MILSKSMLLPPVTTEEQMSTRNNKRTASNSVRRKIDYYFISDRRSGKFRYDDDWRAPETILSQLYEMLPEIGNPVSLDVKPPYYLYGIFFKTGGDSGSTPSLIMSWRRCIELKIDGVNTTIDARGSKLFVIDYQNKIEYELVDSFRSRILV